MRYSKQKPLQKTSGNLDGEGGGVALRLVFSNFNQMYLSRSILDTLVLFSKPIEMLFEPIPHSESNKTITEAGLISELKRTKCAEWCHRQMDILSVNQYYTIYRQTHHVTLQADTPRHSTGAFIRFHYQTH